MPNKFGAIADDNNNFDKQASCNVVEQPEVDIAACVSKMFDRMIFDSFVGSGVMAGARGFWPSHLS